MKHPIAAHAHAVARASALGERGSMPLARSSIADDVCRGRLAELRRPVTTRDSWENGPYRTGS